MCPILTNKGERNINLPFKMKLDNKKKEE
jgi:hypothetical protein